MASSKNSLEQKSLDPFASFGMITRISIWKKMFNVSMHINNAILLYKLQLGAKVWSPGQIAPFDLLWAESRIFLEENFF